MASVRFSAGDERRLAEVLEALDPGGHDLLADCRALLEPAEWELFVAYARARLTHALRLELALRGVVRSLGLEPTAYAGRGVPTFVREALAACRDSFAPMPDCWRVAPVLDRLDAVRDADVLADIRSLELLAQDRMFGSFEDDLRALLG